MHTSIKPPSLQVYTRIAGFLYLLIIVFGLLAQVIVRDGLVDYADASVTATNIMASGFLYRLGFASELIMLLCDTVVAMILYVLFRRVARDLALVSQDPRHPAGGRRHMLYHEQLCLVSFSRGSPADISRHTGSMFHSLSIPRFLAVIQGCKRS